MLTDTPLCVADVQRCSETKWQWWAGSDKEWMTVGPCATRDEAIERALKEIGAGPDIIVLEACRGVLDMNADFIIDRFVEDLCDDHGLYSSEHSAPEWDATAEQQKEATAEMQAFFDTWMDKWRHTFTEPHIFTSTRNKVKYPNPLPARAGDA